MAQFERFKKDLPNMDRLYEQSLELEPREREEERITRMLHDSVSRGPRPPPPRAPRRSSEIDRRDKDLIRLYTTSSISLPINNPHPHLKSQIHRIHCYLNPSTSTLSA
jgi:hypothetical protein